MILLPIGLLAAQAVSATLLLDTLAATVQGAYSLRPLRTAYTGYAIRVRRSSDNAEQDIGFSGGGLDTVALLAFCGSGSGYVSKWYDQSGNGQDVAQATASKQPQIVASGAITTLGNSAARPGLLFAQSFFRTLTRSSFVLSGTAYAAASVASRTTTAYLNARVLSFAGSGQSNDYSATSSVVFGLHESGGLKGFQAGYRSSVTTGTNPFQSASVFDGSTHTMTVDGTAGGGVASSGTLGSPGLLCMGSYGSTSGTADYWDGVQAEHVVISGALSSGDQAAIRTSQQTYYGTP